MAFMRLLIAVLGISWLVGASILLVDATAFVNWFNLHELLPLDVLLLIWSIIGLVTFMPLYLFWKNRKED